MIAYAAGIATGLWLALMALTALRTRPLRPAPAQPGLALPGLAQRSESPAVVSLLARRLDGYPATLLDLAARGWFSLVEADPGRVICQIPTRPDHHGLAPHERLVASHIAFRAGETGMAPAAALGSGFVIGDKEFHELFEREVRAGATSLGLVRRRLSGGLLAVLAVAGLPALGLVLAAFAEGRRSGSAFVAVIGYLVGWRVLWVMHGAVRRTRAGQDALAEWLGFRAALTGSDSRPTAGSALLANDGDRRIAYAAALGAAPGAVAAFRADDNLMWSSYRGSWHRVTIGKMSQPLVPGVGMLLGIGALTCLLAAMALTVGTSFGWKWGLLFAVFPGCIWWLTAWWVFGSAARARRLPPVAEFDGQILKRWTEVERGDGDNGQRSTHHCIAIDDGERETAWVLVVEATIYAEIRAGMIVHVRVDPRRNTLVAMSPAGDAPFPRYP